MRVFAVLLLALGLSACANLTHYQPTGLLEIPEITDTEPGDSLDVGTVPTVEYTPTTDPGKRSFTFDPKAFTGSAHFARARFPLSQDDIEFGLGLYSTAGIFGSFKYQFWGPKLSHAKAGDTSLAIVGLANVTAAAIRSGNGKGDSSGGYPWEAKISGNQAGASVLFGWRWKEDILLYGGPYGSYSTIQSDVSQSPSTEGSDPGGDYRLIDYFLRFGPVGGMMWTTGKYSMQIEGAFLMTKLGRPITVGPTPSISFVFRYDNFRPKPEKYY